MIGWLHRSDYFAYYIAKQDKAAGKYEKIERKSSGLGAFDFMLQFAYHRHSDVDQLIHRLRHFDALFHFDDQLQFFREILICTQKQTGQVKSALFEFISISN